MPESSPALSRPTVQPSSRRRAGLLIAYLGWWTLLAIAPWYRQDWLLENMLVLLALPLLLRVQRQLSDQALTALFVFGLLHAIGAHYTYAEVPYERWTEWLFGRPLGAMLGFERNHFDRLVHFCYGLLVTPAISELLEHDVRPRGIWRVLLPFTLMAAQTAVYEVIEWLAAIMFGGPLGQAYLGTQGDVWDAQKDSALAMLGALVALAWRWQPGQDAPRGAAR